MDHQEPDFASSEFAHQSVRAQISVAIFSILRQVAKSCGLIVDKIELTPAENSKNSGFRQDEASSSPSDNWCDAREQTLFGHIHVWPSNMKNPL